MESTYLVVDYERAATAEAPNGSKCVLHVGTDEINIIDLPEKRDLVNYSPIKTKPISSLETYQH